MKKLTLSILTCVAILLFIACEDTTSKPETDIFEIQGENGFLGTIIGTDAYIAILVASDEALVYVCNGEEEISEWFKAAISSPTDINLTNSHGAQIVGKFSGSSFTGEVTFRNANTFSFTATPNIGNGTGVFQVHGKMATEKDLVAGWIVNSTNDDRGALIVRGVFQSTPRFRNLNEVILGPRSLAGFSFPVRRFFLKHSVTTNITELEENEKHQDISFIFTE